MGGLLIKDQEKNQCNGVVIVVENSGRGYDYYLCFKNLMHVMKEAINVFTVGLTMCQIDLRVCCGG